MFCLLSSSDTVFQFPLTLQARKLIPGIVVVADHPLHMLAAELVLTMAAEETPPEGGLVTVLTMADTHPGANCYQKVMPTHVCLMLAKLIVYL